VRAIKRATRSAGASVPSLVVFVLLLAVLAAFGASYVLWERTHGPSYGTRFADGRVLIVTGGVLHELDAGRQTRRIPLTALGIGMLVTEVQALASGEVLIGDPDAHVLKRCDLTTYQCAVVYGPAGSAGALRLAFKVAIDEEHRLLYLTDTENHRLLLLDFSGALVGQKASSRELLFPTELVLTRPGRLLVADTGNRRLVELDVSGRGFGAETRVVELALERGRFPLTPIALRGAPDRRTWVVMSDTLRREGELVVLAPDGKVERQIDLGGRADPLSLVVLEDRVLALDPTGVRVWSVGPDFRVTAEYGDRAFNDQLAKTRRNRRFLGLVRTYAPAALLVLLLAAIVVAVRERRTRG
jgi:hypothetical protein